MIYCECRSEHFVYKLIEQVMHSRRRESSKQKVVFDHIILSFGLKDPEVARLPIAASPNEFEQPLVVWTNEVIQFLSELFGQGVL